MIKTLKDKLNELPEKRRNKILLRANELIQEELNVFGLLKGTFVEDSVQWQKKIRSEWT